MKIRALSHIKHDGKTIAPGKSGDVPDGVGKQLIAAGAAEKVAAAKGNGGKRADK